MIATLFPVLGARQRKSEHARFNATVFPPLAQFLGVLSYARAWENGTAPYTNENCRPEIPLATLESLFGDVCTVAHECGDVAFFAQLSFLMTAGVELKNTAVLSAYRLAIFKARLQEGAGEGYLPGAAEVGAILDAMSDRPPGTTPASAIKDLCNRQGVRVTLARGKRGPIPNK